MDKEKSEGTKEMWSKTKQVLEGRLAEDLKGRKIRELADNIDNEPEWFRKWILLRAGAAA